MAFRRCGAPRRAKRTGKRCKKWAVVGTTVCHIHGATGARSAMPSVRLTMAQLFDRDPRHPWEVVLDMTHKLDVITQEFQAEVLAGENVTVDQLDRLIELARTTHHLATTAISTKAHENVAMAFTRHLDMQGQLVATAIAAGLDKLGLTGSVAGVRAGGRALGAARRKRRSPGRRAAAADGSGRHGVRRRPHAATTCRPSRLVPTPCDVTALDDDALRSLGEQVLDELERGTWRVTDIAIGCADD